MHDLTATKFVCHVCSDRSGLTTTFARWRGAPTTAPQLSSYLRALIEKPRLRANRARDEAAAGQLETRHRSRKHPTSVIGVPKAGPKRGGDAPRNHAIRMFATAVLPVRRSSSGSKETF